MKSYIILVIFGFLLKPDIHAQDATTRIDSVEVIKGFNNLYRHQNIYIGAQPSLEVLRWLKARGVCKIINLRSDSENNEYLNYAYNEESIAKEIGFEYYSLPINGSADYSPENLELFMSYINENENILIHCTGAGRATTFFMAYLIKNKGYAINDAVEIGKDLRFSFPLERLLNIEINMNVKD